MATTTRRSKTKLTRPRVVVTLYQGTYEDELAELYQKYERAERKETLAPTRFASKNEAAVHAAAYDALLIEAEEDAVKVTLEALPRRQWQELVAEHPPRDDDEDDEKHGVNRETFFEVFIQPCVVEPKYTDAQWAEFSDSMSHAQYNKMITAAWNLNIQGVDLPKSSLVSRLQNRKSDG